MVASGVSGGVGMGLDGVVVGVDVPEEVVVDVVTASGMAWRLIRREQLEMRDVPGYLRSVFTLGCDPVSSDVANDERFSFIRGVCFSAMS